MRWLKILAVVLGSVWFFPVSCTTSLFAGTWLVALYDARDARDGDMVHPLFSIVFEPGDDGAPFGVISLRDQQRMQQRVDEIRADDSGITPMELLGIDSYLMSVPAGRGDIGQSNYSYRVLEQTQDAQLIEVVEAYHDGDNTIWSRYQATATGFTPLTSRMFYFGYSFPAIPFAFGVGVLLYGIGRLLRRKLGKAPGQSAHS